MRVCKDGELTLWKFFAGTEFPPGFGKGIQVCASLWEEALGMEQPSQHRGQSPRNRHKEGDGG